MVLVDPRPSHNFLFHEDMKEPGLQLDTSLQYMVEISDGHKARKQGVCRGVKVEVPSVNVIQDFYLFDLGGVYKVELRMAYGVEEDRSRS